MALEQKVVPSHFRKRYPSVMFLETASQRVAEQGRRGPSRKHLQKRANGVSGERLQELSFKIPSSNLLLC